MSFTTPNFCHKRQFLVAFDKSQNEGVFFFCVTSACNGVMHLNGLFWCVKRGVERVEKPRMLPCAPSTSGLVWLVVFHGI